MKAVNLKSIVLRISSQYSILILLLILTFGSPQGFSQNVADPQSPWDFMVSGNLLKKETVQTLTTIPSSFGDVKYADLNGDGFPDYVHMESSQMRIRHGQSDGTFGSEMVLSMGSGGWNAVGKWGFTDINGDGCSDYYFVSADSISIKIGQRDSGGVKGTVGATTTVTIGGGGGWNIEGKWGFADINGDGRSDYYFVGSTTTSIKLGQANGTLGATISVAMGGANWDTPKKFGFIDINGDGRSDYYYVDWYYTYVKLGQSDGTLGAAVSTYMSGGGGWNADGKWGFSDINGDGRADYYYVDYSYTYIKLGQPDGTLGVTINQAMGGGGWDTLGKSGFSDINGDGRADYYYLGSSSIYTKYGLVSGGLGETQVIAMGSTGWDTIGAGRFIDLNKDRRADRVQLFGGQLKIRSTQFEGKWGFGKFNSDSIADFYYLDESKIYIKLGTPTGNFGEMKSTSLNGTGWNVIGKWGFADFNGDGLDDYYYNNGTSFLINYCKTDGSGTFQNAVTMGLEGNSWDVVGMWGVADLTGNNGDSGDDCADLYCFTGNTLRVKLGNKGGGLSSTITTTFDATRNWTTPGKWGFKDVTGDGRADYYLVQTNGIYVRRALYDGALEAQSTSVFTDFGGTGWDVQGKWMVEEINGDGQADYVYLYKDNTFNPARYQMSVCLGQPTGKFAPLPMITSNFSTNPVENIDFSTPGKWGFADIGGDGIKDYYLMTSEAMYIARMDGQGSAYMPVVKVGLNDVDAKSWDLQGSFGFRDLNGDKRADFYFLDESFTVRYGQLNTTLTQSNDIPFGGYQRLVKNVWGFATTVATESTISGRKMAKYFKVLTDKIYAGFTTSAGDVSKYIFSSFGSSGWNALEKWGFADVNGDGNSDYYYISSGAVYIRLASSDGTYGSVITTDLGGLGWDTVGAFGFADITGDAREDFYYVGADRIWVRPALSGAGNEGKFGSNVITSFEGGKNWDTPGQWGFVDIDGDGKKDYYYMESSQISVKRGTATGSLTSTQVTAFGSGGWNNPGHWGFADVNGDGKSDYYYLDNQNTNHRVIIKLGLGNGSFGGDLQTTLEGGGWYVPDNFGFKDLTGDGKEDFYLMTSSALYVKLALSGGNQGYFGATVISPLEGGGWNSVGSFGFADFNGDLVQDLYYRFSEGKFYVKQGNQGAVGATKIVDYTSVGSTPVNQSLYTGEFKLYHLISDNTTDSTNAKQTFTTTYIPNLKSNVRAILKFKTRADYANLAGTAYFLGLKVNNYSLNGKNVLRPKSPLVFNDGRDFSVFADVKFATFYSPNYDPIPVSEGYYTGSEPEAYPFGYEFDITTLLVEGENQIDFLHLGQTSNYKVCVKDPVIEFREATSSTTTVIVRDTTPLKSYFPQGSLVNPYSLTVQPGGGMQIETGGESYTVESSFRSQAISKTLSANALNWTNVNIANQANGSILVTATSPGFNLERTIEKMGEYIQVKDKMTNNITQDLGMIIDHSTVTPVVEFRVGGVKRRALYGVVEEPYNPTTVLIRNQSLIAFLAEDDVFRLQSKNYYNEGNTGSNRGGVKTDQFILKAGSSVTLKWSLFPLPKTDYFSFVNVARRKLDVNFKLEGGLVYHGATPKNLAMDKRDLARLVVNKSSNYVVTSYSNLETEKKDREGNDPYSGTGAGIMGSLFAEVNMKNYIAMDKLLQQAASVVNKPFKHLVYYNCFIDNDWYTDNPATTTVEYPNSAPQKHYDSRVLYPEGGGLAHWWTYSNKDLVYFPTTTNSFGAIMKDCINIRLTQGGEKVSDGIYWDEFEWSGTKYHYPPIDANGVPTRDWDGVTGNIDGDGTITRRKSLVSLLSLPWKEARIQELQAAGKVIYANGPIATESLLKYKIPMQTEGSSISNARHMDLYSPILLGNGLTEVTEVDAYKNMVKWIQNGVLYGWFSPDIKTTRKTLSEYMYPFTPIELAAGYLIGQERILVAQRGIYGWNDASQHEVYVFDDQGARVTLPDTTTDPNRKVTVTTKSVSGKTVTELDFPEGFSAAIIKR